MRLTTVVLLLSFSSLESVKGLSCWNCLGKDCDESMTYSVFSEKQNCDPGALCMKTINHFLDLDNNITTVAPAVKSCSYVQGCTETTRESTEECKKDVALFASFGCTETYCCDSDFCNSAPLTHPLLSLLAILSAVRVLF